jgi:hypothetical protein
MATTPLEKIMEGYRFQGYTDGQARELAKDVIAEITGDLKLQNRVLRRALIDIKHHVEAGNIVAAEDGSRRKEALLADIGMALAEKRVVSSRNEDCVKCGWNGDRDEANEDGSPPATWSRSMHPHGDRMICSHCQ